MNPHKRKGANPRYAVTSSREQCIQQEAILASNFLCSAYDTGCINESVVEDATLAWLGELGCTIGHGPHMAPGEPVANDVFGLPSRISICSSLNLDLSPNLDAKIDADGCLIEGQLTLPLSGELSVVMATCKDYLQVQRATIVRLKGA